MTSYLHNPGITIHLGLIPEDVIDWTDDPVVEWSRAAFLDCTVQYAGTSFVQWGEELAQHEPHEFTVDFELDVDEDGEALELTRDAIQAMCKQARQALSDAIDVPRTDWRLVDYVVVTDRDDHSVNARTVGCWGY